MMCMRNLNLALSNSDLFDSLSMSDPGPRCSRRSAAHTGHGRGTVATQGERGIRGPTPREEGRPAGGGNPDPNPGLGKPEKLPFVCVSRMFGNSIFLQFLTHPPSRTAKVRDPVRTADTLS